MEDGKTSGNHLTSAAAFVEGGIQEACDACSICLEDFSESDPSTVTSCKHEFHLQCVLEWCQRSSQCPMCWQLISLKDPGSQELLDAVERERNIRMKPPRTTAIFRHPTLGDFELQHLPVSATESELEERIIQHLAAAAAMGRARQLARREGQRNRSATQGRPHLLVFSTNPDAPPTASAAPFVDQPDGSDPPHAIMARSPNSSFIRTGEDSVQYIIRSSLGQADQPMTSASGSSTGANQHETSLRNMSPSQIPTSNQDRAGSSDFQSFSESLKSRVSAWSTRYKESISKSTRSWKEKLFNRNNPTPTPDPSTEVQREVDQAAPMSRLMDHLDLADNERTSIAPASSSAMANSNEDTIEQHNILETDGNPSLNEHNPQSSIATGSMSN